MILHTFPNWIAGPRHGVVVFTLCCAVLQVHSPAIAARVPAPSTRPTTRLSPADEERLRAARQTLMIARNECLQRLRQTEEFKKLSQKLEDSQQARRKARENGTVQQQVDAEQTHLQLLLALSDLMMSSLNANPDVREAQEALRALEASCSGGSTPVQEKADK